jgi:hypothetical protein
MTKISKLIFRQTLSNLEITVFINFHKQKYTLLSKICSGNTQWTATHNTQKFRRNLGKCQGKPQCGETQRERERESSYYYASGKYKTAANLHFQLRKIPHSTKSVPQKSASFFVPKPHRCPVSSVPCFPCPQSSVQTISYGPETATKKSGNHLKNRAKNRLDFHAQIHMTVRIRTVRPPTAEKIFRPKTHRKFFSRIVPSLLLTFLSQACSKNLSNSPLDVLSTCLAHYPMHSFII